MSDLIEILDDLIVDHWSKLLVGLVLFVLGRWWGRVRSKREWTKKEFHNRVTVSLNLIQDGRLKIRTVLEKEAKEIFINDEAVATVLSSAARTTGTDPMIRFPKADRWHLLNAVLNEIAEDFKVGLFAQDMGQDVTIQRYLFCATREVAGEVKAQKIRVMLIQPQFLEMDEIDFASLETEVAHHNTRLQTLELMRQAWKKDKDDFMSVEIVVPS